MVKPRAPGLDMRRASLPRANPLDRWAPEGASTKKGLLGKMNMKPAVPKLPVGDKLQAALTALVLTTTVSGAANALPGPWSTKQFLDNLNSNGILRVVFTGDGKQLLATDMQGDAHPTALLPSQAVEITQALQKLDIPFNVQAIDNTPNAIGTALNVLGNLAPLLIFGLFLAASRRGGMGGPMGGGGPMGQIGKSKSKIQMEPQTGVTFDDVAGAEGSKLELNEVVDFLKDPSKYSNLGAKIPKGVIMEGPPGTGKTLLARAVAGEAGVPFISSSASEFVEMFVGVGAARVRDLFNQAKKNAPCIIFIDEIDAIGRQRAAGGNVNAG